MARYSKHSSGSASYHLIEKQNADQNESGEESEQESMEVDEMTGNITEADYDDDQSSEDDDDKMAELTSQYPTSTLSSLWPDFICRIDVFGNKDFDLAVNKDMQPVLVSTREENTLPGHLENLRQWECIRAKKWLRFRNVATRKYLGVDDRESKKVGLFRLCLFDWPKYQTRFSLERRSTNSAWLEFPFMGELCSLIAKLDLEKLRSDNFIGGDIHVGHDYHRPEQAIQIRPSEKLDVCR
jgi:hypothetical protein